MLSALSRKPVHSLAYHQIGGCFRTQSGHGRNRFLGPGHPGFQGRRRTMTRIAPDVRTEHDAPDQATSQDRIRQRAEKLGENGYVVSEALAPHVFLVTHPQDDREVSYRVNPVAGVCTCPYFERHTTLEHGETTCKHLLGLSQLIEETLTKLRAQGCTRRYYVLAAHWSAARQAMRRRASLPMLGRPMPNDALSALDAVRDRVREDDRGKWDVTVPREALMVRDGRLIVPEGCDGQHPHELAPGPWATAQMCQRLRIPVSYFRRCPTRLQDEQANHWLRHGPEAPPADDQAPENGARCHGRRERWLLRAKDSSLRGVLSDRYARMDNATVLDTVASLLDRHYEVGWFALTPESLHVRLVDPRIVREALPDDRLMAGIHLANSEVGRRAVTVDAMVYRLVCTNGLIRLVRGASLFHQRHVSFATPKFEMALRDAIRQAWGQAAVFMEQLVWSTSQPVRDVEKTLANLTDRWNLTNGTEEAIKGHLKATAPGQQETLYGLVNAITRAAQALAPDDRYDLEALAGQLMEQGLSPSRHLALLARPNVSAGSGTGEEA